MSRKIPITGLARRWRLRRRAAKIAASPLFQADWYLKQNPDVRGAGMQPALHYVVFGAAEGRWPHPLFDPDWYRQQLGNVTKGQRTPLEHYLSGPPGARPSPHPLFDQDWYLEMNPDVRESGLNPFIHYLQFGASEGRDPNPLFDSDWYLKQNQDVTEAGANPLTHYVRFGASEGRDPNPLFDTDWYLEQNPDVAESGVNPLVHYLLYGADEGRNPNPLFDTDWYLQRNMDVAESGVNPLAHYLRIGADEGRDPNPLFDTAWYRSQNPDVAEAGVNPLVHYLSYGAAQGCYPLHKFKNEGYLDAKRNKQTINHIRTSCAIIKRTYQGFDKNGEANFITKIEDLYKSDGDYENVLISIIMPTFNRGEIISNSIESVMAQSHKNWELIIVDDGSTDRTRDVVKPFLSADKRIHYVFMDHVGLAAARNHGLMSTTGEFVAYLDTDNTWEPDFLRNMVAFMASQKLDAAYSAMRSVDDSGRVMCYRGDIFVWSTCIVRNYIDLNCFVHRRDLAINDDRRELFDTSLKRVVDWDFILRLTGDAKVSYAPFIGVNYYDGDKIKRVTRTEYQKGEMRAIMSAVRAKHEHRRSDHDNLDTGSGLRFALRQDQFAAGPDRYILRFYPDYRVNNPYQDLLYQDFENYDIQPGTIDDCLKLALVTQAGEEGRIVLHLHWLSPLVSPARDRTEAALFVDVFLSKARLFVSLGGRVLWTVHNVISHEPRYPDEEVRLSKGVIELAEWIHVHHPAVAQATKPFYELPSEKILVAEHGNYIGTLPISMNREQARKVLGIPGDAVVFLFLGQIRSYKGIDDLVAAFAEISKEYSDCWLVIAGKVLEVDKEELKSKLAGHRNTVFRPGYVADDQMQIYLKSADASVLPYRNILTSGSVFLSMSSSLPVICPRMGQLSYIIEDGKNGFLYDADDTGGLVDAMRRLLEAGQEEAVRMGRQALRTAEGYRWSETAARLRRHILLVQP